MGGFSFFLVYFLPQVGGESSGKFIELRGNNKRLMGRLTVRLISMLFLIKNY